MTALPLLTDADPPGAAMPPTHLADLDRDGRRSVVAELGLPGYRADQVARHYYGRLCADPAQMSDLPASAREALGAAAVKHAEHFTWSRSVRAWESLLADRAAGLPVEAGTDDVAAAGAGR